MAHRRARRDAQHVGQDRGWCLPDELAPCGQPARPGRDAELVKRPDEPAVAAMFAGELLTHDTALAVGIGALATFAALVAAWLVEHELTQRVTIPSKAEDIVASYRARATDRAVKAATSRSVISRKAASERRRDSLEVLKELGTADVAVALGASGPEDDGTNQPGDKPSLTVVSTDGS